MGSFILKACRDGTTTLIDPHNDQSMHSSVGLFSEAHTIYLEPSRIRDRLTTPRPKPLVVWDVGLGVAGNAVTLLELFADLQYQKLLARKLEIHSFESDLQGLRTALNHPAEFPYLDIWRAEIETLLAHGSWTQGPVTWKLWEGDFRATHPQAAHPEVIFYDFYSPSSAPELWNWKTLSPVIKRLRAHSPDQGCWLSYTAATSVRSTLLLAGLAVARGPGTQQKSESTLALTRKVSGHNYLTTKWIEHLKRSERPWPEDLPEYLPEGLPEGLFEELSKETWESPSALQTIQKNLERSCDP